MTQRRALFLDRDGVINVDHGYVCSQEAFEFIDGVFDLCLAAQRAGYLVIVVTNQAGIGRGYFTEAAFRSLTDWMCTKFREQGVEIAHVYYCPYHPEHGVGVFRRDSEMRKPNPGMILKAAQEFVLDLQASLLVGDKETDVAAGRAAGVGRNVLLPAHVQEGGRPAASQYLVELARAVFG